MLRGAIGGSAGVTGLWLLACSSSNNNAGKATNAVVATVAASATRAGTAAPASGTARPGGSPAAQAGPQPRRGGTINIPTQVETPNQDVQAATTAATAGQSPGMEYSGLVKPQSFGTKGAVVPVGDLAASWEQPDQTTYVFRLRTNVKFHNIAPVNGRVATAQDVVYSANRQLSLKVAASYLAGMTDIAAVDPATVKLTIDTPNVDFIVSLVDPRNKVVAHEAVELKGDLKDGPTIGTGPWIWKDWQRGVSLSVTRNPDYFLPGLPYADAVVYYILKDASQIEAQFQAGKLSYSTIGNPGVSRATASGLDKKKYAIWSTPPLATQWVMFNLARPQFKDARIRQALNLAIDRKLISQNVYDGQGVLDPAGIVLPGPDWKLPDAELQKLQAFDPQTAKQMLSAAGGLPQQTMHFYEASNTPATAQIVQANWKAIGLDTSLQSVDNVALVGNIFNPAIANYDVATSAIAHASTFTGDAETWFKSNGSRNSMHINDTQLDSLITAQKQETNEQKRRDLVNQIQRLIIQQGYNLSLVAAGQDTVYPLSLHNVEISVVNGEHRYIAEMWLEA